MPYEAKVLARTKKRPPKGRAYAVAQPPLLSKAGGGAFTKIAMLAANADNRMDTGVTAGTAYTYRVRATNVDGASLWSNEASATP